jgi:hypothetical protein
MRRPHIIAGVVRANNGPICPRYLSANACAKGTRLAGVRDRQEGGLRAQGGRDSLETGFDGSHGLRGAVGGSPG